VLLLVGWALGPVEAPLGAVGDEAVCVVLEPNKVGVIRTVVGMPLHAVVAPMISAVEETDGGNEWMAGLVRDACAPGTHIGDTWVWFGFQKVTYALPAEGVELECFEVGVVAVLAPVQGGEGG
jgi:hypothetical protein